MVCHWLVLGLQLQQGLFLLLWNCFILPATVQEAIGHARLELRLVVVNRGLLSLAEA